MKPQDSALIHDPAFQQGLATRTQVMGESFVDRAFTNATDYTLPMQEFITRNAWGTVWQREGLPRRDRSLMTVVMLVALNRPHELRLHLRGALNNGLSREELREALLHAAVYCGMPAAVDAFRAAREVFAELDAASG
jgi:4-carboxymuconolactone decarboxylase